MCGIIGYTGSEDVREVLIGCAGTVGVSEDTTAPASPCATRTTREDRMSTNVPEESVICGRSVMSEEDSVYSAESVIRDGRRMVV